MFERNVSRWLGYLVSIVGIALALMLFVYRTESGLAFAGAMPTAWLEVLRRFSGATSAESWADFEFKLIAVSCLLLAAILVALVHVVLRRRRRS